MPLPAGKRRDCRSVLILIVAQHGIAFCEFGTQIAAAMLRARGVRLEEPLIRFGPVPIYWPFAVFDWRGGFGSNTRRLCAKTKRRTQRRWRNSGLSGFWIWCGMASRDLEQCLNF
jgi:hypothetical protein